MEFSDTELAWRPIRRILNLSRFCGLYISFKDTCRPVKFMNLCWTLLVLIALWADVISGFICVPNEGVYGVMIVMFKLQNALFMTAYNVKIRHVHNFLPKWEVLNESKSITHIKKIICRNNCAFRFFIVCVVWTVLSVVAVDIYLLISQDPDILVIMMPTWVLGATKTSQLILFFAMTLFMIPMVIFGLTIMFAFFMLANITYQEFNSLKNRFQNFQTSLGMNQATRLKNNSMLIPGTDPEDLEDIRIQHGMICNLVDIINATYGLIAAICLGFGLLVICLSIYNTSRGLQFQTAGYIETGMGFFYLLTGLEHLVLVTVGGILLSINSHCLQPFLYSLDTRKLTTDQNHQLQVFLSRLNGPHIGLSVIGMFTVTKESILTITGALLTYAIIMFEFSTSTITCLPCNNGSDATISNMTGYQ